MKRKRSKLNLTPTNPLEPHIPDNPTPAEMKRVLDRQHCTSYSCTVDLTTGGSLLLHVRYGWCRPPNNQICRQ